jgi:cytochrome c oxidase subunit 3
MADRAAPKPDFQYATLAQEGDASTFGMWIFIATEVLFFGALIVGYLSYRAYYGQELIDAASHTKIVLGTINTGVLLTSNACMAMAVHSSEAGARRSATAWLWATALLGLLFVAVKSYEYYLEYGEHLMPGAGFDFARYGAVGELFFTWYFCATGLHALHLLIGISFVTFAAAAIAGDRLPYGFSIRILGLYWHFVDVVWIFLFPLIYLAGRNA